MKCRASTKKWPARGNTEEEQLKIGEIEKAGDALFTTAQVEGLTVPALELRVEGPVDEALLEALKEGKLEIYGADGVKQGEYLGYQTVVRRSVVVAKVTDDQQELLRVQARLAAVQAEKEALEQENAALLYESLTGEETA